MTDTIDRIRKPLILMALALVASASLLLSPSDSHALMASGVNIQDDFNATTMNSKLWSLNGVGGGTATQANGYIESSTQSGTDQSQSYVNSLFALTGDFDVQVDYAQISQPTYWSHAALTLEAVSASKDNMKIYISRLQSGAFNFESTYYINGTDYAPGSYYTPLGGNTTGKFRIVRTGSTMSSYFWRNSSWVLLTTGIVFDGPARVRLELYSNNLGSTGSAGAAIYRWDNFIAQSQGVTGAN